MPTKYTDTELAQHVRAIIDSAYGNPISIKSAFQSQLSTIVKNLAKPQQLIESEIEERIGKIAVDIYEHLHYIGLEYIEPRISMAIKNASYHSGIELSDYNSDFQKLAKILVSDLIKFRLKQAKESLKAQQKALSTKPKAAKPKVAPKRTTPKKPKKR